MTTEEFAEALKFAAKAIEAASPSGNVRVQLWGDYDALAKIPGARACSYAYVKPDKPPYAIDCATWTCGRVEFETQRSRDATKDEVRRIAAEGHNDVGSGRSVVL